MKRLATSVALLLSIGIQASDALTSLDSPANAPSGEPHLVVGPEGEVVMSWLETHGDVATLKVATLVGNRWVAVREIARGDNWFVNWADFPSVVLLGDGYWFAHWLVRNPRGRFAYDIYISDSTDNGMTWAPPRLLHVDGTASEHGFVSIVPASGGADVVWLDGRDIANGTNQSSMTLRTARVVDGAIRHQTVVDQRVCDCCQTDAAATESGLIVVYRDRSADEIRDIASVRRVAGFWTQPSLVAYDGWYITGCPVNGPAVDARGSEVVVAWPTGTGAEARVRWSRSIDEGATFGGAVDVDVEAPVGRVDVALLDDGRSVVSWMRRVDDEAVLSLRTITVDGKLGEVHDIARMASTRGSGFPQMVASKDQLVIAWTDVDGPAPRVLTTRVRVP